MIVEGKIGRVAGKHSGSSHKAASCPEGRIKHRNTYTYVLILHQLVSNLQSDEDLVTVRGKLYNEHLANFITSSQVL